MRYVAVAFFDNYIEAHLCQAKLEQANINCWLKDEYTVTIDPVLTQAIGGIKLMVHEAQAERAQDLLAQWHREQQQGHLCPACGAADVQLVSSARKPANWLTAVITFLLGSYAIAPEKKYHCFACGHEFLPQQSQIKVSTKQPDNI